VIVKIVMTIQQYTDLQQKPFPPGDPDEHFGFAIAGRSRYPGGCNLLRRTFLLADKSCLVSQSRTDVRPDPRFGEYAWTLAEKSHSGVIDVHTHPFCEAAVRFSSVDDRDDEDGFAPKVACLGPGPHASVVLGVRSLDARWYDPQGRAFKPVEAVRILGETIRTIIPTSARR
jgi:hypothetical protein